MVFHSFPGYDMGVSQDPAARREPAHPALVPVSAEDFARGKRRVIFKWLGAGVLIVLLGVLIYQRSTTTQDGRKAFSDGEQLLNAGRYAEAIQSFDRAVAAESGMTKAYLARGRANAGLNQTEAAVRDFTKASQLQSGNAAAFLERASVRMTSYDYPAVIADCGEAISRDPKIPYAYTLRGMAYREMGNLPKSLEDFDHAVALAPGLDTYFQRASTYQSMGDHAKAIADLNQVVEAYPTSPMGYLARAKSRTAMGDLAGARTDREMGQRLEVREPGQ